MHARATLKGNEGDLVGTEQGGSSVLPETREAEHKRRRRHHFRKTTASTTFDLRFAVDFTSTTSELHLRNHLSPSKVHQKSVVRYQAQNGLDIGCNSLNLHRRLKT